MLNLFKNKIFDLRMWRRSWSLALFLLMLMALSSVAIVGLSWSDEALARSQLDVTGLTKKFVKEEIEASVVLPNGAYVLSEYRRYYAIQKKASGTYVVGTLIKNEKHPGIEIVQFRRLPNIFDGGCSVVNILYSINSRKLLDVKCNGVA